jgi:hypothetical protein
VIRVSLECARWFPGGVGSAAGGHPQTGAREPAQGLADLQRAPRFSHCEVDCLRLKPPCQIRLGRVVHVHQPCGPNRAGWDACQDTLDQKLLHGVQIDFLVTRT